MKRGFSLIEILLVSGIIMLITALSFASFSEYKKSQALRTDTDLIVETLRMARALTLASKGATQYGVHFTPDDVTLFSGASYSSSASDNQVYKLQAPDSIVTVNLQGGGSDVIYKRLTGETENVGTITIAAPTSSQLKYVTIYATGLIDSK